MQSIKIINGVKDLEFNATLSEADYVLLFLLKVPYAHCPELGPTFNFRTNCVGSPGMICDRRSYCLPVS